MPSNTNQIPRNDRRTRKSSYLKLVGKFHPDWYPSADEVVRDKLSQLCAAASEAWKELETVPDAQEQRSGAASNGHKATSDGEPAAFDSEVHARGLYDRALNAFEKAQYWDAIQLVREAIAADEHVAEYYALHGRALLQN